MYALNQFCHDEFGMKYNVEDYWVYEFAKIWGCTQVRHWQRPCIASVHMPIRPVMAAGAAVA